mmetsp:Transcript_130171/g.416399  ORF Transcript_130171/g.416399 Transcript_130171/m.416399 type:complete len:81 (-) Transcript_130171:19-261(-)
MLVVACMLTLRLIEHARACVSMHLCVFGASAVCLWTLVFLGRVCCYLSPKLGLNVFECILRSAALVSFDRCFVASTCCGD